MFLSKSSRFVLLFITCVASLAIQAQTLYWVGGSGNFNDQKHWSLSSGGKSSNQVPSAQKDVIFDDNSSNGTFQVNLNGINHTKAFLVNLVKNNLEFTGNETSVLNVHSDFNLNQKVIPSLKTAVVFSNQSSSYINFSGITLNSKISFVSGDWVIYNLKVAETSTVNFISGNYTLNRSSITVGNLVANTNQVHFVINTSYVEVKHKFLIGPNTTFDTESATLIVNKDNQSEYQVPSSVNLGSGTKIIGGNNQVNACGVILNSQGLSCFGANDGKIFAIIDPTCAGTYTLQFSNPGGCTALPTITVTAGSTYTFSNLLGCFGSYQAILIQGGFPVAVSNFTNVTAPPAISFFPFLVTQPSCFGDCNGSFSASWSGGSQPYTIVHAPAGQTQYTSTNVSSGIISYTSLCAGANNFTVTDFNGCVTTYSNSIGQPSLLTTSIVNTSVSCNSFSNGALAVSPVGGTPNYTVNFSIGTSQVTGSLGTVSSSGLPAGPITATVIDANGCTTATNALIVEPTNSLSVIVNTIGLTCFGVCAGSATALVTGGTAPYSYTWSSNPSTVSTATGYCASVAQETLIVRDFNNCSNTSQTFSITQPPAISAIPSQTNVVCSGSATGVASLSVSGGTGVYTYSWTAPGPPAMALNTSSQTGLFSYAAPYTVTVRDANNCTITPITFTITQPPAITLAIVTKSVDCFGGNTGGATVTATGGNSSSYTYTWSPTGGNAAIANTLIAGPYNISVRDASLCLRQQTFTINQPTAGITPVVTFSSQSCNAANAACNGSIFANPTGGSPPFTYTLQSSGAPVFTNPPYTGLCSGSYTVIVGSSTGLCPVQAVVTLTTPAALNPNITINTPIACNGASVGGLTGNAGSGGTPTYALTWVAPTGTIPGNPTSISSLTAGVYTLIVTDARSCSTSTSINLTQPSSITIVVATSSILCFSGNNGAITSTASGGSPGYSFAWTNSLSANVGTTSTASGLAPGPYTLTVTDASLCPRTQTASILSPPPITLTAITSPVLCFGGSTGSVTLTTSGGTGSFSSTYTVFTPGFTISPACNPATGIGTINILAAGNYTASIFDSNNCLRTTIFAITQPTALAASITGTGSCNVCSGSATVTPSFGTSPYFYLWSNSLVTQTVGGLCPANYSVTVTDSKGCTTTTNITISQIINITINPGASSILCFGATTGSATTNPGGGISPYTYSWSPSSQTTQVISGVGAGSYTVRVTDSSVPACSHTAAITLTAPPAMVVNTSSTNVTCFSFSNGAVGVNVSGGTPGSPTPYTYTWTPTGLFTSSLSGIPANSYTVNIRDGNLCPTSTVITISQSPSISIAIIKTNPTGCISSLSDGSICATASGGTGAGYSYTLTGPSTNSSNTSGCFTGLGAGTYSIIVTDGALCSSSTNTTLTVPLSPTISVSSTAVACFGFLTGVASATATGATPTLTIAWTPTTVVFTQNGTGSLTSANNLPAGIYFVSATDGLGCVTSTPITVGTAPAIVINGSSQNLTCNNISTGSITVAPTGGTPGSPSYTYAWVPPSGNISAGQGQGTASVTALAAGIYTLNLLDANLCSTPHTFTITQPPALSLTAVTASILCNSNCTGSIVANANGGTGSLNYSWTPVGGNTPTVTGLCASGTGTNPPSYTLTVTDQNTCSIVNTYTISQPSVLSSTVSFVSASCSGSCNAVATNSASGGIGAYAYSWNTSTVSTSSLGALCTGTYIATVTDGNGCVTPKQFTITPPAPLSVTLTPVNPLCNAACNGSITTLVSGAQGLVSYFWTPAGSGQNPTGLCAVPNPVYTLVAIDQNSCEVTAVATLTNPPALLASVSFSNPLCNNDVNGIATVSFTNAVGATNYNWIPTGPPTQTAQTATGLASGSYTVLVQDNNACQTSVSFSLANPSVIIPNASIGASSCSLSIGQIILNPTGGTPGNPSAYTYSWSAPISSSASSVFSLAANLYSVQITDGNGCTTFTTLSVSDSNGPNGIPITSSSITCNSQCNGSATVDSLNITGGTAPYTFIWSNSSSTLSVAPNLCAGIYNLQVTDVNSCVGSTTVSVIEPSPILNAPSIGLPLCVGVCDGTISLNTSGGIGAYTYSWSPGSSNSPTLANLCPGDYTVVVGYNTVCRDTSIISIPVQTSITIVPTLTNNLCFGNCNGAIDLSLNGGTSPYSVSWSNSQTSVLISGLCNGTYSASVIDANGCLSTQAATISSGAQITTSTSAFSPLCGLCNGTASVSVAGGVSPFSFNWSNAATTPSVSNLCAGVYQVLITDNNLCTQTETIVINNSNGITGETINAQQIPCSGACVGAATVTAIGGNPPIAYNWVGQASTTSTISNLCPGTYFVQMVDAQNCVRTASVNIDPLVTLSVSAFLQLPACGNNTAGVISLVISGGTPSYAITWNPPAGSSTTLTGLGAGVYSYTVTESGTNSCSISNAINFSNSNGPVISASQNNINCFGANTGSIGIIVTSTAAPLTYTWNTGANTPTLTNLNQGIITLTVTDVNSCKAFRTFTITENPAFNLGAPNVYNPRCLGDCTGSITLVPSGGVLPYNFVWSPNSFTSNPVTSLCDGNYSVNITDALGCPLSSTNAVKSFTIKSTSAMTLTSNTFNSSCSSVADGSITVTPSGGVAAYNYAWNGPSGYTSNSQNPTNILSGIYSLTVTDNLNCQRDTTLLIIPTLTVTADAGPNSIICPVTGSVVLAAQGTGGTLSYKWFMYPDTLNSISSNASYTVSNLLEPEMYKLIVTSSVASCFSGDAVNVDLFFEPTITITNFHKIPIYTSVTLGGNPTTQSGNTLTWTPNTALSDPTAFNPLASNTLVTTYTLTVTDINGCIAMDTVRVELYPEISISSGFTPNGDGKNDVWLIDYLDQFPNCTVEIYNRWGDRLFNSTGYNTPFDGKFKGQDLPVGTYYYVINVNHPGYPKAITGPLTLFR